MFMMVFKAVTALSVSALASWVSRVGLGRRHRGIGHAGVAGGGFERQVGGACWWRR
jgi:hypothetical protein